MNSRTTLVVVLVALVIGGLVALDFRKGTSTDDARAKSKRLVDVETHEVTRLELVRTNETIVLEKAGDRWQIKQPLAVRADGGAVDSLLDELQFGERERTITRQELASVNLADFGLDRPRLTLTVQTKKGAATLLVGKQTPTKESVYLQVKGRPEVYVANKSVADRLDRSLTDLRDRVVLELQPATATRLEIRADKRVLELARTSAATNAAPRWAIVQPLAARADQQKVNQLLTDLNALRCADFVSDNPPDVHTYKLDEPAREITVWQGAAESGQSLLIGGPLTNDATKVYAKVKGGDSIFTIATDAEKKLELPVNDLRDPQLLVFTPADVRGLTVQRGAEQIALAREARGWRLTKPIAAPAEESRVQELLDRLSNLRVKQFTADVATDLEKFGLTVPGVIVSLEGATTNGLVQLLVGSSDASNGVRYVKCAAEPFVYGVETNLVEWLPGNPLALRERRLATLRPEQITKLVLAKEAGATSLARGADGKWRLVAPAQGSLNADALQNLVATFAELRAEEFVSLDQEPPVAAGLDKPLRTITATVGDKSYVLRLGKPKDPQTRYAAWSEPALVFTLSAPAVETLTKDIVTTAPAPATSTTTNHPAVAAPAPPK